MFLFHATCLQTPVTQFPHVFLGDMAELSLYEWPIDRTAACADRGLLP